MNEKPLTGCMGRMINILAPSPGTKLLSNKPHQSSSISDPVSSSTDSDGRRSSPGVVARLMGLDALPASTRKADPPQEKKKKMDLVREKFMEAKRLATDQRLLKSKEFQDALEVLSSNRDLFLKFLEEPNSLFSQPPAAAKRITVLKPSKTTDESLPPPTRIVVLKPSPRKGQEPEPPPVEAPSNCREVAKEITRQIRESLGGNRREEALLSSVLSNGYTGDESSFNSDNLSDSELISWEQGNRPGSPFSLSSLSRGSYSPDSLIVREAKKRLSERWTVPAAGAREQQQRHVRRSSSTLGEMLSIPEKKEEDNAPPELLRSKSVPSSSSSSKRNLFKGKVSSLFFSRSKKQAKEKDEGDTVDQPGPASAPAARLEDVTSSSSHKFLDGCRREMISRSPPIGSVARSLSRPSPKLQDEYSFVKLLLETAGLGRDATARRWHSLESPLDPALLERFLEGEDDAKCREQRSGQRLLFDATNSALLEMARTGCSDGPPAEEVWRRVRGWWSATSAAPRVMTTEVAEFAWDEMLGTEREEISCRVAAAVTEEMIVEALLELMQRHYF